VIGMGVLTTVAAFVGGYVTGTKLGDRPIVVAKETVEELRGRAGAMTRERGRQGSAIDLRTVREVMSMPVASVRPDASLREAATLMRRDQIGDVLVADANESVTGIVTDRDLVIRAMAEDRDPSTTVVGDVMSPIEATITPDATVSEALALMRRHDVRRLPVLEGGSIVGVVSLGDLSQTGEAGPALADISTAPANG
jgi:CBS domain-containing protein